MTIKFSFGGPLVDTFDFVRSIYRLFLDRFHCFLEHERHIWEQLSLFVADLKNTFRHHKLKYRQRTW